MSKIGKKNIIVPKESSVKIEGNNLIISGPKGSKSLTINDKIFASKLNDKNEFQILPLDKKVDKKTLSSFIESLKTFNRSGDKSDFHKGFGLNFKITDLQAAMGNSQFKKLGKHIEAKKKILDNYKNNISDEFNIIEFTKYEVPWFIDICFNSKSKRTNAINNLDEQGIETRLSYPQLSKQKYLKKYANNNLNYSESVYEKILWMPSSINLTKKSISNICSVINE